MDGLSGFSSRRESESVHSQTSEVDPSRPIALRRGVATSSIGDVYVPKCLFTLHIGTVVLSDEAVLNSRDKTLVLTWKFYDQNIAMTRMRAGRVVLFDFSTEYDIKITDDFLHYMKHEEMPIVICELDKEDQPFASCALPLRDALLHTNRRADMSLALVAGPQMLRARAAEGAAADALDARDEMGVIDLWCMLRADAKMLSGINLAIAQVHVTTHMCGGGREYLHPSVPEPESKAYHVRNSRVMPQILDDDHNDLDLNLVKSTPATTLEPTVKNYGSSIVEYARSSSLWSNRAKPAPAPAPAYAPAPAPAPAPAYASSPAPNYASSHTPNYVPSPAPNYAPTPASAPAPAPAPAAPVPVDAQTQTPSAPQTANKAEMMYDPSNYPPVRSRRLSCVSTVTAGGQPVPFSPPAQPVFDKDDPEHDSGIIINEVQANIKSPGDMRHALEQRSGQALNEMGRGMRKSEEDLTSQAQSSLGSLSRSDNPQRAAIQNIQRNSKNSTDTPTKEQGSSMEIYKKYENISKLIGSNKDQSKKSVKIVPKYMETDNEEPQRDVGEGWAEGAEDDQERTGQNLDITVLWLALNEECEAMIDPHVQRVYVAYTFLGRTGAELETPISLPKPKHYVDKCYFNFRKTFELEDTDLLKLSHMARCRAASKMSENERDCIVFSVVSEPPEDPLGLESCEDIGYAYLYLGDLLAYSAGSPGYTEVIPVRAAGGAAVCGVLAVRLDGLDVVRRCLLLPSSERDADWET
ncbi:uncharacterized protein LOC124645933 [Helicoverpa zea]|uniref:uncharacterized protein LOC124645933 n=1 Tax=Helicoverpa zea TaxID=7113 RepID=UPI001F5A27E6|nr:uncharacterized protein LOC124645933 [Helicoverpa zea]